MGGKSELTSNTTSVLKELPHITMIVELDIKLLLFLLLLFDNTSWHQTYVIVVSALSKYEDFTLQHNILLQEQKATETSNCQFNVATFRWSFLSAKATTV